MFSGILEISSGKEEKTGEIRVKMECPLMLTCCSYVLMFFGGFVVQILLGKIVKKKYLRTAAMTPREAIKILMLSPMYFRMDIRARRALVKEFCSLYQGLIKAR